MIIREAILEDALSIAKVHIDSWKTTYKGIIEEEYLSGLSYEKKENSCQNIISGAPKENKYIFVAEDKENGIVGFACCGNEREGDTLYKGELVAIYIIEECQSKGIGNLLFKRVVEKLKEVQINSMIIWVLEDNLQGRRFYELKGGKKIKEKHITIGNVTLKEIAYGWPKLEI